MPIFTNASALWGTLIFLGLVAIYIYRRRSRNIVVSSLMFFSKSKSTAEGGQKLHKLQTPFIFFLEILIFLLLILAIADPMSLQKGQVIPISIVLDDSLSMTAGGENSAQKLALKYLEKNILSRSLYRFTIILAGERPKIIGRRDMPAIEAESVLRGWKCESVSSNLMVAVSQAIEMNSEDSIVIVLTDHLNNKATSESIKWIALGKSRDNLAITSANRSANGRVDRCFFEFTNFSDKSQEIDAEIIDSTNNKVLEKVNGKIAPRASRRVVLKIFEQKSTIKAIIKNDEISYDNEIVLLPIKRDKLKVALNLQDHNLSEAIKKAVLSTDMAVISNKSPNLIISNNKTNGDDSLLTELVIYNATQSLFVARNLASDKEFPLTSDLPLEEGFWVADTTFKKSGKVLLISGKTPLICLDDEFDVFNTVYLNYSFNNSNMNMTNFWPVFFYNLLDWTMLSSHGPSTFNYKSGSKIDFITEKDSSKIIVRKTSGNKTDVIESYANSGKVVLTAGVPGLYELEDGDKKYTISVNLCSFEESDLSKSDNCKMLPTIISDDNLSHFVSVKWWFIITAFILLLVHQWLISKRRAGYAF